MPWLQKPYGPSTFRMSSSRIKLRYIGATLVGPPAKEGSAATSTFAAHLERPRDPT
jgi:hypothetical protein